MCSTCNKHRRISSKMRINSTNISSKIPSLTRTSRIIKRPTSIKPTIKASFLKKK